MLQLRRGWRPHHVAAEPSTVRLGRQHVARRQWLRSSGATTAAAERRFPEVDLPHTLLVLSALEQEVLMEAALSRRVLQGRG
jgi:hypothetical protein